MGKKPPAKSSIHEARQKAGWGFFRRLLLYCSEEVEKAFGGSHLYKGHKVYAIDGTRLNLPRELKKIKYKGTHKGCFYPQGLLVSLYRLKLNIPVSFELRRKAAETKAVPFLIRQVDPGSVVAYDRLYFSINTLVAHKKRGVHGVFRLKTGGTIREVTKFIASKKKEQILRIYRPKQLDIKIRLLRYKICGEDYYLATTLLDQEKYPARSLMDLYHARWGIEESFKYLKQRLQLQKFNSRHPTGIKQEIAASLIMDLLTSIMTIRTGRTKKVSKGVGTELFSRNINQLWTTEGIVQNCHVAGMLRSCRQQYHQSKAGRSFPRRSRKVINRWQKSIAWEWDKKKRQALRDNTS